MVYSLEFRVSLEPRQRTSRPLCPVDFANKIWNKAFDLAIIEYYAVGFIADQASGCLGPVRCNEIGWDVNHVRFQAEGLIRFEMDLIPAEDFIRRYLKGLTDRFLIPQQPHQALGEIRIPCEHPKRRSIAGSNHLLSAFHAIHNCPGIAPARYTKWNLCRTIRMRRTDNRNWKAFV